MTKTRNLLSWDNGKQTVERIILDESGNPVCPNLFAHLAHSNAIWTDWDKVEVWNCSGIPFNPLDPDN